MTSTVSYANIAKGKGAEAPEMQKETKVQNERSDSGTPIQENDTKEEMKTKKTLAPAPVPEKSAWGSAASTPSVNYSKGVDEHKWPTPDKASSGEHGSSQGQKQQKFINSVTHKWVPITPKVVMPNPKTNNQKNYKNKKSKKTTNRKRKQNNGPKQSNQTKSSAGTNESVQSDSTAAQGEAVSSENSKDTTKSGHSVSGENSSRDTENKTKNVSPVTKGKSAGMSASGGAKQKSSNNAQVFGRQQQPFYQYPQQQNNKYQNQNGFFQPQPYYQGSGFQGNNRGGRSNNFRANGGRFAQQMSGYPNGVMNYPPHFFVPQIPLPISPNQDPQQALTQQIDYYFSLDNLIKDIFLRKNMNADGWVPLSLILNFKRVKIIVNGIQNSLEEKEVKPGVIFDSLKDCTNLEVNCANGKDLSNSEIEDVGVRVKGNYEQWLLPNES